MQGPATFFVFLLVNFGFLISSQGAQKPISVHVLFEYKNFPAKIELHSIRPEKQFSVSETRVVDSLKDAPVTGKLNSPLQLAKGQSTVFALVISNTSKKTLYFFASPHEIKPVEASIGQTFECLCNHSVFKIGPGKTWYRIVRIEVTDQFQADKLSLVHSVIGVSSRDANKKYKHAIH